MTNLSSLTPNAKKSRIRRGRGNGSKGTFSGRGCKGQNSRAGGGVRLGFEGGQSGVLARMPKLRGFRNPNRVETEALNLYVIEQSYEAGETVNLESLLKKGIITGRNAKVKLIADGELNKKVTIAAEILISASAKVAVEKAGGTVEAKPQ
jgi:large subunit ribosomal protein L15